MDITDVKRLWGTPLGVIGAYSGPSGAPPVTPVTPNRCPCAVLFSTGRGVLHLAREGPTARFRHDGGTYWTSSKHVFTGRRCQCFRERFQCTCDRWGLYRFYRVWKILSCGVLGLFLFRPCLPRFAVVIFTAIFPLGYPGVDVTFR